MENEPKEKAIVVTHLNDIFQEKGDELLPVIASSAQIINFLNYMNSPLPNNELETIITKLTTLIQQSPYVGKILTEYPINNNKTIFEILVDKYLNETNEEVKNKTEKLISIMISNIDCPVTVYNYIYRQLSELYRTDRDSISAELMKKYINLLSIFYGKNMTNKKPTNYFYFASQGVMKIDVNYLIKDKIIQDKNTNSGKEKKDYLLEYAPKDKYQKKCRLSFGLCASMWVYQDVPYSECDLLQIKTTNEHLKTNQMYNEFILSINQSNELEIKLNNNILPMKTKVTLKPRTWAQIKLILKPRKINTNPKIYLLVKEEDAIQISKEELNDCSFDEDITDISAFKNFYGRVSSFLIFNHYKIYNKTNIDSFKDTVIKKQNEIVSIKENINKLYSEYSTAKDKNTIFNKIRTEQNKLRTKMEKNKISDTNKSLNFIYGLYDESILYKEFMSEKEIVEKTIFAFVPFQYYKTDNNEIVLDNYFRHSNAYFLGPDNKAIKHVNGVNMYHSYMKNIFYLGGITNLLPIIEIIYTQFDKLIDTNNLSENVFTDYINLLKLILIDSENSNYINNNIKEAIISDFFPCLSLFLNKLPNILFREEEVDLFIELIPKIIKFSSKYFDKFFDILLSEQFLSKLDLSLQQKIWETFSSSIIEYNKENKENENKISFHPKEYSMRKILFFIHFYDSNKFSEYCCTEHKNYFLYNENAKVMDNRITSIQEILYDLLTDDSHKSIMFLFYFLNTELSPCVQIKIIKKLIKLIEMNLKKSNKNNNENDNDKKRIKETIEFLLKRTLLDVKALVIELIRYTIEYFAKKLQKNKNEKLFDDDFFSLLNNNIFFGEIQFNPALISKPIQPQNKEESKDNNIVPVEELKHNENENVKISQPPNTTKHSAIKGISFSNYQITNDNDKEDANSDNQNKAHSLDQIVEEENRESLTNQIDLQMNVIKKDNNKTRELHIETERINRQASYNARNYDVKVRELAKHCCQLLLGQNIEKKCTDNTFDRNAWVQRESGSIQIMETPEQRLSIHTEGTNEHPPNSNGISPLKEQPSLGIVTEDVKQEDSKQIEDEINTNKINDEEKKEEEKKEPIISTIEIHNEEENGKSCINIKENHMIENDRNYERPSFYFNNKKLENLVKELFDQLNGWFLSDKQSHDKLNTTYYYQIIKSAIYLCLKAHNYYLYNAFFNHFKSEIQMVYNLEIFKRLLINTMFEDYLIKEGKIESSVNTTEKYDDILVRILKLWIDNKEKESNIIEYIFEWAHSMNQFYLVSSEHKIEIKNINSFVKKIIKDIILPELSIKGNDKQNNEINAFLLNSLFDLITLDKNDFKPCSIKQFYDDTKKDNTIVSLFKDLYNYSYYIEKMSELLQLGGGPFDNFNALKSTLSMNNQDIKDFINILFQSKNTFPLIYKVYLSLIYTIYQDSNVKQEEGKIDNQKQELNSKHHLIFLNFLIYLSYQDINETQANIIYDLLCNDYVIFYCSDDQINNPNKPFIDILINLVGNAQNNIAMNKEIKPKNGYLYTTQKMGILGNKTDSKRNTVSEKILNCVQEHRKNDHKQAQLYLETIKNKELEGEITKNNLHSKHEFQSYLSQKEETSIIKYKKNIKLYKKKKKQLFSWNNAWSSWETFFPKEEITEDRKEKVKQEEAKQDEVKKEEERKKSKYCLKYKVLNHFTENLMRPIITPILDIKYYLPSFSSFKLEDLFDDEGKEKGELFSDIYSISLNIEEILQSKDYTKAVEIKEDVGNYIRQIFMNKADNDRYVNQHIEKEEIDCCFVRQTHHIPGKIKLHGKTELLFYPVAQTQKMIDDALNFDKDRQTCYGSIFKNHKKDQNRSIFKLSLNDIKLAFKRKYFYSDSALEIYTYSNKNYYFKFKDEQSRDKLLTKINEILKLHNSLTFLKKKNVGYLYPKSKQDTFLFYPLDKLISSWQSWKISTFEFLMWLNVYGNRSYRDMTQYPVLPWVVIDCFSDKLLKIPKTLSPDEKYEKIYRNLSLPVGMLSPLTGENTRKNNYITNYNLMLQEVKEYLDISSSEDLLEDDKEEIDADDAIYKQLEKVDLDKWPYFYGSHYSNPIYVNHYLLRLFPYSQMMIEMQGNKFDDPQRLFLSIKSTFNSATTQKCDVRELVPEFYYLPEMYTNLNHLKLGYAIDESKLAQKKDPNEEDPKYKIDDVILPPWAHNNPFKYIAKITTRLNKTDKINEWADLIFGFKQRGQKAIMAKNVFLPYSYEQNIKFDKLKENNDLEKLKVALRMVELGLTPFQLLRSSLSGKKEKPTKFEISMKEKKTESEKKKNEGDKKDRRKLVYDINDSTLFREPAISFDYRNKNILVLYTDYTGGKSEPFKESQEEMKLDKKFGCNIKSEQQGKLFKITNKHFYTNNMESYFRHTYLIYGNDNAVIIGGYYDGSLVHSSTDGVEDGYILHSIQDKDDRNFSHNHPNEYLYRFDYSPIVFITLNKSETSLYCGTMHGSLMKLEKEKNKWDLKLSRRDHTQSITYLNVNDVLNVLASCSYDGYVHLYTLPEVNLFRSIYIDNTTIDYALLSSTPVPSVVIYSQKSALFKVYGINGKLITSSPNNSNQPNNTNQLKVISPIIYTSYNFVDYLVYGNSKGAIKIRKLPFLPKGKGCQLFETDKKKQSSKDSSSANKNKDKEDLKIQIKWLKINEEKKYCYVVANCERKDKNKTENVDNLYVVHDEGTNLTGIDRIGLGFNVI